MRSWNIRRRISYTIFFRIVAVCVAMLLSYEMTLVAQYSFLGRTPFYQFDLPHSIEGNEVQDVYHDREGYIWFATKSGLMRYNGTDFKIFRHSVTDSTTISYTETENILETKNGDFWISTWGGGFNKFDRTTETFTRFRHIEGVENSLSNDFISDMVEDQQGYIWIATGEGLSRFNPQTAEFKNFYADPEDPNSLSSSVIRKLYIDSQQTLWVGTGYAWILDGEGGLNKYDPKTESFTTYLHNPNDPTSLQNNKISAIFEDSKGNFWIGTGENGIHIMDRDKGSFNYLADLSKFEVEPDIPRIRSFFEMEDGSIWICSYGSGMKQYDLARDRVLDFFYNDSSESGAGFPLNNAWRIYRSNDGTLWIFTGDVGETIYKSNTLFPHMGTIWQNDQIQSIFVDQITGDLWMARRYNGLNRMNWTEFERSYTWLDNSKEQNKGNWWSNQDDDVSNLFDNIFASHMDQDGIFWFAKLQEGKGLYRFDASTGNIRNYRHQANQVNSLAQDTVVSITESLDDGRLWVLTRAGVLHQMDQQQEGFKAYRPADYPNMPDNATILYYDKAGNIWLGSIKDQQQLLLTKFDRKQESFTTYPIIDLGRRGPTFEVVAIKEDSKGQIWLASDRSLSKLDQAGQITTYSIASENYGGIRSMLFDEKENIWMATTTGLAVFNTELEEYYLFPTEYEFFSMPFNFRSAGVMKTGELLFCGAAGCLLINEESKKKYYQRLEPSQTLEDYKVLITGFRLNGEVFEDGELALDSILASQTITLGHLENNFSFEFSLLDFNAPRFNRFEYFLENYDNYWRKASDQNMAYYSQIPPGTYTLKVRGYNSIGEFGEAKPIQIIVLPPWWLTWWAYCLYALLFLGLFYAIYRFQLSKQLAKSETQRLQELDAAKSQLYTNITHEFRTPLTVILGMAKQLDGQLSESQNLMVEMIGRNGQNLLNLVNQMLDLSKLESGQLTLKMQQGDLIAYLRYLVESFHSFADGRGVKVHFLSDVENQSMDFDPDKIQQIISNLLSNAIKFTPTGGDIYIRVNQIGEQKDQLSIKIKDTGVGIDKARLPYIFKRFYQADDSNTKEFEGTGIGLALVAELVKLMRGEISVKSELGKGTELTLILPIEQNTAPNQDLSYYNDKIKKQFYRENLSVDVLETNGTEKEELQKPTVLIVEDNFDVRTYIRACLGDRFHLIGAENGQRGIEKALKYIPDFIISDVMMPHKDGYELVKELKTDPRTSHIPIILLTAKADTDSKLQGLVQGADAYLAKPFNPEELLIRINKLLELRKRLQQHYLSLSGAVNGVEKLEESTEEQPEDAFVQQVKSIILERLDDYELNVQTICSEIGMSHSQLHRKLSALTGLSTNRFIRHIRLTKAKELLRDPSQSITAIAFDTGYKDPSYFGRVFKQETGMTPADWQKQR